MQQDNPLPEEFPLTSNKNVSSINRVSLKLPLKVIRLCVLGILVPCLLTVLILYTRYRIYVETLYPLAMSDMRTLDNRVSTIWCQGQTVKVNATFNAFLLPEMPNLAREKKPLSMVRHLVLEDDTKEYWGFYLLRGSIVTLSTCVRWPGASLIVIRGHKHLHECAYIGDDSSEELDEIMEAIQDGTYIQPNNSNLNQANKPELMKRHRDDVEFHHETHKKNKKNYTLSTGLDMSEITDPKHMKSILSTLTSKKATLDSNKKDTKKKSHVHRNSTVAQDEMKNFKFLDLENRNVTDAKKVDEGSINKEKTFNTNDLVNDVVLKLKSLGQEGESVLKNINNKFMLENNATKLNHGRQYSKPLVKFDDEIDRDKREINFDSMKIKLNQNDFDNDMALEEGFSPDGIADHHGSINETTLNDRSNSEFWSSFSSSEEALLNCTGLILNLPLTPHTECKRSHTEEEVEEAYLSNTISYIVPTNGYYFFVFNSENEIQPNYIRIRFHIKKTVYNTSNYVEACTNETKSCEMNLRFFSNEKLVIELPIEDDESLWNEEFIVTSECRPRTALYIACVIAIPVLVILFAFQ